MKENQTFSTHEYMKGKKVALVHDFLVCRGGAERVLEELSEMFPEAPIYTLLYDKEAMRGMFDDKEIRPSFLQKFPNFLKKRYRFLLPFFPVAVEAYDLRDFDVVISSSGAWSKGVVTRLHTKHIAYIHSPMRYVWDYNEQYLREIGGGSFSIFKRMVLSYMRVWDRQAADRPDVLIANSKYTQSRIEKYYRRESRVIYPPCHSSEKDISMARNKQPSSELKDNSNRINRDKKDGFFGFSSKEYFLVVSRLTPNKKVEVVVEAFNKLKLPLIVVGDGPLKERLKDYAEETVRIVGWQDDVQVVELYKHARAFIFSAEDDFGMTMVEAMHYGCPVIAYEKGGSEEIIEDNVTGSFFRAQTPEVLADGVRRFLKHERDYDASVLRKKAKRFSKDVFREAFLKVLEEEKISMR